ncbi:MAG: DUF4276 family protein [Xenococcaceae cyanobacterium MO_207.B15]|nr:DUF4276 family protein [Xenococcaceae cyanobacterium MO_207.B15]
MKEMLKILLPKIIPDKITYKCIPHEGKQDLEKSIPIKLKAFPKQTKFIILRDKDSGDCLKIKQQLFQLCQKANRPDTLIRIPCHELESWFLGDLVAVEKGLKIKSGKLARLQQKAKYRNPDNIGSPKQELRKIAPNYQPITGSRAIAKHLNLCSNNSQSFQVFIQGLKKIINELQANTNK